MAHYSGLCVALVLNPFATYQGLFFVVALLLFFLARLPSRAQLEGGEKQALADSRFHNSSSSRPTPEHNAFAQHSPNCGQTNGCAIVQKTFPPFFPRNGFVMVMGPPAAAVGGLLPLERRLLYYQIDKKAITKTITRNL